MVPTCLPTSAAHNYASTTHTSTLDHHSMHPNPPRRSCGYSTMPPPRITPLAGLVNVFFGLLRPCGPSSVLARPSFISSTAAAVTLSRAAE
eukprot:scaffold8062_cov71-Cyclotella_meneghiniana.AAC.2